MATQYINCPACRAPNDSSNTICLTCGSSMFQVPPGPMQPQTGYAPKPPGSDKKMAAGLCGILLGGFGVHKFILGYTTEGIIMAAIWLVGAVLLCGIPSMIISIIGIVEGIMYLTKSDEEFVQTYIVNKKAWF